MSWAQPDEVVDHRPAGACEGCGADLAAAADLCVAKSVQLQQERPSDLRGTPLLFMSTATMSRSLPRYASAVTSCRNCQIFCPHASEECVPFVRHKTENRPSGIPAVADADFADRVGSPPRRSSRWRN